MLAEDLGELLERHEAADLDAFGEYRERPVAFAEDVLRADLWDAQQRIAEAVLEHPLVAVRSCNGAGKDFLAGRLALWWAVARQGLAVLTGPTASQVTEILMRREVRDAFSKARHLPGELHVHSYRPRPEGRAGILARTATTVSALTGFHDAAVLFIVTEAQGVEGHAWDAAFAVATGAADHILALGNPLNPDGRFYQACRPGSGWHSIRVPASEIPNVRAGRVVVPGLLTQEGIDRMVSEYGAESGYVTARVHAEFPEESEEGLFRRSWLDEAAQRWGDGELEELAAGEVPVASLDPARFGPDASVLAWGQGPVVRGFESWPGRLDTMQLADKVEKALRSWGFRPRPRETEWRSPPAHGRLVVDEVGVGGGVTDVLRDRGWSVTGFNGGAAAKDRERYFNLRAESYWTVARKLERGELALPRDEELFSELLALRWRPTPAGQVQLESKSDLKARIGRSPDRSDALSMLVLAARRRSSGMFNVHTGEPIHADDPRWSRYPTLCQGSY
jgi:hypothetical protein